MIEQGDQLPDSARERRLSARRKMFEPITLILGSVRLRAHLLDMSCAGALAHCETPPAAGSYVAVSAFDLRTSGRVKWVIGKRFGIQFSQLLSPREVEAILQKRRG